MIQICDHLDGLHDSLSENPHGQSAGREYVLLALTPKEKIEKNIVKLDDCSPAFDLKGRNRSRRHLTKDHITKTISRTKVKLVRMLTFHKVEKQVKR